LTASGISVIGAVGCASSSTTPAAPAAQIQPTVASTVPSTSNQALQTLLEGNLRFQRGQAKWPNQTVARRQALAPKQTPLAMVFGCVDSRVPPELVFDQGLGDIFDIRTAGHVVDSIAMGSIEVGIVEYGIPLLVVLGHQRCGAVSIAVRAVDHQEEEQGHIQSLVEYIRPSVLKAQGSGDDRLANAVRNNIIYTVSKLSDSKIISDAVKTGKLTIVAGHYDLDTGVVSIITD
jgi:carbonic anhydrase